MTSKLPLVLMLLLVPVNGLAFEEVKAVIVIPDDANVQISGKTFKQLKALIKYVCSDRYLDDRTSIMKFRKDICDN